MGMYLECQNELIRALKAAGCSKDPYTSRKKLLATAESRVSAVLCEEETVERSKGKKLFTSADGERLKRSMLYSRDISFLVIIGDYNYEKIEKIYESFLKEIPRGIYVDGNYVSMDPTDADWVGEKDHLLYSKVSVQVKITCHGGLYRDTDMAQIKDVDLEVRKEG